jgi:predicted DNA-binding transcriptional regulator YafY
MTAASQNRVERLKRLEQVLPLGAAPASCPDGARLLEVLRDAYGDGNVSARRRALQRDLEELVKEGRIEAVNPGGKPLRYRRVADDLDDDPGVLNYTLQQIRDLVAEAVPKRRLDRLWQRLLTDTCEPRLDETRLRIVPDTLRLQPVALYEGVLSAVIAALTRRCALRVLYRDAEGVRGEAYLHPQAVVQRGPIPYLFALKNDESEPVRLYALHRMIRAEAQLQTPAREAKGFDLDQAIEQGLVDFGQGEMIHLELRVRGYIATVVTACPLEPNQTLTDEPLDSDYELRLQAHVPSTGQLLRWLLGAGDNVEVIAPAELRLVVAVQAAKMAAIYANE